MIALVCIWWVAVSLVVGGLWVLLKADMRDPVADAVKDIFLVSGAGIMAILLI